MRNVPMMMMMTIDRMVNYPNYPVELVVSIVVPIVFVVQSNLPLPIALDIAFHQLYCPYVVAVVVDDDELVWSTIPIPYQTIYPTTFLSVTYSTYEDLVSSLSIH